VSFSTRTLVLTFSRLFIKPSQNRVQVLFRLMLRLMLLPLFWSTRHIPQHKEGMRAKEGGREGAQAHGNGAVRHKAKVDTGAGRPLERHLSVRLSETDSDGKFDL
jgi:hypothetical protein